MMTTDVSRVITPPSNHPASSSHCQRPGTGPRRTSLESSRVTTTPDLLSDPATDPFAVAEQAAAVIAERTGADRHDVALVLGSGWGQTADLVGETLATVDQAEVPGFHGAAVAGHSSSIRSVAIGDTGRRALVFGTRTHFYEGRGVRAVVHGVRTAKAAGCSTIVLTNGCGGLNPVMGPRHAGAHPRPHQPHRALPHRGCELRRPHRPLHAAPARPRPRGRRRTSTRASTSSSAGRTTRRPAEVAMARVIGGDLVGMSTSLEAIAARQVGLDVLGISLVTNLAAGISDTPLSHAEVLEAGQAAAERCGRLLAEVVGRI